MKQFIIILVLFLIISPIANASNSFEAYNIFVFNEFMFNFLPGSFFPNFFLENYAPDITLLTEENNGFSHIDNPRVYFEGESYINFNWNYDEFNINSALDPGRAAIIFPFSSYSKYTLKGHSGMATDPGLFISSANLNKNYSYGIISSVYSDMGSYTPLGPIMIQPEHPSLRDEMLYSTRRKIVNNYFIDYMISRKLAGGLISLSFDNYYIKRAFNDFGKIDEQFEENGNYLVLGINYKKKTKNGNYEILGGINSLKRDNEFSELGRLPGDTLKKKINSYIAGFKYRGKKLFFLTSLIHENSDQNPVSDTSSSNIFDNDGDDIFKLNRYGKFSATIFSTEIFFPIIKEKVFDLGVFAKSRLSILSSSGYDANHNLVYAGNSPYQVFLYDESENYTNSNYNFRTGMNFSLSIGKSAAIKGDAYLNMSSLQFDSGINNVSFNDFGFDIGFHTTTENSSFYFNAGRTPGKIKENVNYFLETSGPSGAIYYWTDINNDNIYQKGEESGLYGYTGGRYHTVDDKMHNPVTNSVLLLYSTKISRNFFFNLKALYKQFLNNPWVLYNGEYGFSQKVNGLDLYFIDSPIENYSLTNHQFDKDPFYAELLLNFSGRVKERWFFSFSFMAHMGMGYTAFGNGPNSNDIGIINESMGDPNSWINGFGRVDGDRGFVSKLNFGYFLSKKLFLGMSIKYRDGDPFAFLNSEYKNNQWILYYSTIKAENEKGIKGGPREDYVSDISLKLSYSFKIFKKNVRLGLSLFNILDFGSELSEYVFSGGERYSLEMQIPKSLRLSLAFEL